jgi:CHAT domain-containing protein/Tfp pilus assembly protein PilF
MKLYRFLKVAALTVSALVLAMVTVFIAMVAVLVVRKETSISEVMQLDARADALFEQRHYQEAIALQQRALATSEKALGPEDPETATSLDHLAALYRTTGAYAKAEPLYLRALSIREKALGPEHPNTAASLNNLAELYRINGAYAKAEPLYLRALAINEKALGPEDPKTAVLLNNLATLYYSTGAYAKAEPLYVRALTTRQRALGSEHPDTAASLNNLAALYRVTGAYAKAEPLLQRALAINEKARGPEHPDTAALLNNLAELYERTGAYAKAEPLYLRVLAISEKVLGPEHPDTALSLNNLAELYRATGAYGKAEALFQRSLAINEKALGPEHPRTALSLDNLAGLYDSTGAYAKAERLFQQALAIREKALGPEHPGTANSLNNLAALYEATGAYAKAEWLMERVEAIEESNTRRFLLTGSEARQQAYLQLRIDNTIARVSFSLSHPTTRATALALTGVLQYKGRILDSISGNAGRLRGSVAPQDLRLFDRLSGVAQELSTLTYSPPLNLSSQDLQEHLRALAQEQEQLEAQLSSRSSEFRQTVTPITLESVRQALPIDAVLAEWFRYQPWDTKGKSWSAPQYVVFLLRKIGEPAAIYLGPAQPIEDLVVDLRRALSDPTSTYYADVAKDLSEKLVKPLSPHLVQGARLLLSPDAALNLVPFAALVDEHGDYLAKHFEITYLTSGRDLLRMAAEPAPRADTVMLADPSYGRSEHRGLLAEAGLQPTRSSDLDRSGLVFTPLPGSALEAKALQSLLKLDPQNVFTGDRATEAHLRELHGPRILHMATHAFFLNDQELAAFLKPFGPGPEKPLPLGENPLLRAGLALAGANTRQSGAADDGILTAAELAQLDLHGTQLAVLSACETGVGSVHTGEGVYGLRRALVLAGAQAQLVSLWKVADSATQELMVDYYQRLLKGEGRAQALRAAQLTMMTNPARQHPYYWAAFIPIGDWRPLAPAP